jgi:hypothetical protein
MASVKMRGLESQWTFKVFTCVPRHTTCAEVFASASRVKLAHTCGLQLSDPRARRPVQSGIIVQGQAGKYADVETLLVAHELGLPWSAPVLCGAAESGSLPKLQWSVNEQQCFMPYDIIKFAARSGSSEMLDWLSQYSIEYKQSTSAVAAAQGKHLELLQQLYETDIPNWRYGHELTRAVAQTGNLPMLTWLCEQGHHYILAEAVECAALNDDQAMIEYCKEKGADVRSAAIMKCAAESGSLALCQYLHAEQCSFDKRACIAAAEGDHPDILQWLHEQNCRFSGIEVFTRAAMTGSIGVMNYMLQCRLISTPAQLSEMLNVAGAYSHLAAAKLLREHGAEWPSLLRYTDQYSRHTMWSGATLAWAVEQGAGMHLTNIKNA